MRQLDGGQRAHKAHGVHRVHVGRWENEKILWIFGAFQNSRFNPFAPFAPCESYAPHLTFSTKPAILRRYQSNQGGPEAIGKRGWRFHLFLSKG